MGGGSPALVTPSTLPTTYDIDTNGIPKFVTFNYIDLSDIDRLSTFRSGVGHNYSDDFETCRSMKHYYMPKSGVDWSTVDIYSPVNGTVENVVAEWAGYQVHIRSQDYPAFVFILFHVSLSSVPSPGDSVVVPRSSLSLVLPANITAFSPRRCHHRSVSPQR